VKDGLIHVSCNISHKANTTSWSLGFSLSVESSDFEVLECSSRAGFCCCSTNREGRTEGTGSQEIRIQCSLGVS
jgi:hypothetical protein